MSFTTPTLVGSRVRPGDRVSLELIVPNPSGGRGQYVLPWSALQNLCSPTLYDRRLQRAVAVLRGVTPAAIRKITQDVAAEGLAGREAKKSAGKTALDDRETQTIANYYLLLALVQEVMPPEVHSSAKSPYRLKPRKGQPICCCKDCTSSWPGLGWGCHCLGRTRNGLCRPRLRTNGRKRAPSESHCTPSGSENGI